MQPREKIPNYIIIAVILPVAIFTNKRGVRKVYGLWL
jgi:hypothetical protein